MFTAIGEPDLDDDDGDDDMDKIHALYSLHILSRQFRAHIYSAVCAYHAYNLYNLTFAVSDYFIHFYTWSIMLFSIMSNDCTQTIRCADKYSLRFLDV